MSDDVGQNDVSAGLQVGTSDKKLSWVDSMNDQQKTWFGLAIIGLIFADKVIDPSEEESLNRALSYIGSQEALFIEKSKIESSDYSMPELPANVLFSPKVALKILFHLEYIAFLDNVLAREEIVYLRDIASMLYLPEDYVRETFTVFRELKRVLWDSRKISRETTMQSRERKTWLDQLSNDQKSWIGITMVNLIIADGVIEPSEMEYLRKALTLMEASTARIIIELRISHGNYSMIKPPDNVVFSQVIAMRIYFYLQYIGLSDGNIAHKELKFLEQVAVHLGLDDAVVHEVTVLFKRLQALLVQSESLPKRTIQ